MADRPKDCRACRCIIPRGKLACPQHWRMLPADLQASIKTTYTKRDWKELVDQADDVWKEAGVWRPGIPGNIPTLDVLRMRGETV